MRVRRPLYSLYYWMALQLQQIPCPSLSLSSSVTPTTTIITRGGGGRGRPRLRVVNSVMTSPSPHHHPPRWDRLLTKLQDYAQQYNTTVVPQNYHDQELYMWTQSLRSNYKHQLDNTKQPRSTTTTHRPTLSHTKLQQLQDINFCWDLQEHVWQQRMNELTDFVQQHGHCKVPANHRTNLGIWVRNQRREYKKWLHNQPSTLTVTRMQQLQALEFWEWHRSHTDTWNQQFQQLVAYQQQTGTTQVPRSVNAPLSHWCDRQRTAYRQLVQNQTSSLTRERMDRLLQIGFLFQVRSKQWNAWCDRLLTYAHQQGHVQIATDDENNSDLRQWIIWQRFLYHRGLLVADRVVALQRIPHWTWKVRGNSLSAKDWAQLFDAMRAKGIQPGARPKQHWFEGTNRILDSSNFKEWWTEQDLLELWNQEEDDHCDGDGEV